MSWYSKPYLIFFLYIAPTLFTVIAVFYFMLPRHKKASPPIRLHLHIHILYH